MPYGVRVRAGVRVRTGARGGASAGGGASGASAAAALAARLGSVALLVVALQSAVQLDQLAASLPQVRICCMWTMLDGAMRRRRALF